MFVLLFSTFGTSTVSAVWSYNTEDIIRQKIHEKAEVYILDDRKWFLNKFANAVETLRTTRNFNQLVTWILLQIEKITQEEIELIDTTIATNIDLALCMKDNDRVMYWIADCNECDFQRQHLWREAFGQIKYVDCAFQPDLCEEKEIEIYPTRRVNTRWDIFEWWGTVQTLRNKSWCF